MEKNTVVNAFDIIKFLSDKGDKGIRLAPLSNIIAADQNGKKCTFKIGVEPEDIKNYMLNKTGYGGLLLIDKEAYQQAEKQIAALIPPHIAELESLRKERDAYRKALEEARLDLRYFRVDMVREYVEKTLDQFPHPIDKK